MPPKAAQTSLQLDGPPAVRMINSARQFIQDLCTTVVDSATSSRVALAAHEMLENLAKYSDGGPTDLSIAVEGCQGGSRIVIRTSNRANSEQRHELERVLTEISTAEEPMAMYLDIIAKSLEHSEGSGLGLARIRAEADMELSYTISGDEVTIAAATGAIDHVESK